MTYDPHTDWGMAPVIDESGTTPKPRATPDPAESKATPREDDR